MTMALACGQTRVFHFQVSKPVTNTLFPGAPDGHHNLTHDEPGDQPDVHAITVQIITELAYFLESLDAIQEGEDPPRPLLHPGHLRARRGPHPDIRNIPIVVPGPPAAPSSRTSTTGPTPREHKQVTLSLMRAMGINATSWGADDTYTEDGLSAIEA